MSNVDRSMDVDAAKGVADEFHRLAVAISKATEYAGASGANPGHFGAVPEVEEAARIVMLSVADLAESLGHLSGFTSSVAAGVDGAADVVRRAESEIVSDLSKFEGELD